MVILYLLDCSFSCLLQQGIVTGTGVAVQVQVLVTACPNVSNADIMLISYLFLYHYCRTTLFSFIMYLFVKHVSSTLVMQCKKRRGSATF